ncbi:MAG: DUF2877 domain-containing protein, partial [archaeon]|nr:DUF2877 domain-containing protein [archaeon]
MRNAVCHRFSSGAAFSGASYRVHSLFESVVNLLPTQDCPQPRSLLSLVRASRRPDQRRLMVPFGAELRDHPAGERLFHLLHRPDATLTWAWPRMDSLQVSVPFRSPVLFGWRDASTSSWDPLLPPSSGRPSPPRSLVRSLKAAIGRRQPAAGSSLMEDAFARAVGRVEGALLLARQRGERPSGKGRAAVAAAGDSGETLRCLRGMVGLGSGLTPSGDDFLVGVAAAMLSRDHPLAAQVCRLCDDAAASQ